MNWEARSNNTYLVIALYDGDLTRVDVQHLPTGLTATGNARRYVKDEYNQKIGYDLAYYRALERLSHKVTRRLIRTLPVGSLNV